MTALEHRIPPPIVLALIAAAMWLAARPATPVPIDATLRLAITAAFALCGLALAVLGVLAFRRARTTLNPVRPEEASALVTGGVFRYTRNPMYAGLACLLLAWTVWLAVPWALLGPAAFVAYITRFQIIPEERVMRAKFGPVYEAYRDSVRRWV